MFEDIFCCHNFVGIATGIYWVEAKISPKHPTRHRIPTTTEKYPAQNVTNAAIQKF